MTHIYWASVVCQALLSMHQLIESKRWFLDLSGETPHRSTIFLSCQFWWLSNLVKLDSDRHICLGLSHACVIWVQLTCSFQTLSGIGSVYTDDVSDWWLERNKAIRQGPELTHCSLLHCLIAWQFCPCVCFQSAVSLTHFWVRQQSPILTSVGDDPRRLLIFCT